jgi:5'/3'-nucleotidase SurE
MMKILVTNDDGIHAAGLQALVEELQNISKVIVVAPDREQSAIGTAITFLFGKTQSTLNGHFIGLLDELKHSLGSL